MNIIHFNVFIEKKIRLEMKLEIISHNASIKYTVSFNNNTTRYFYYFFRSRFQYLTKFMVLFYVYLDVIYCICQ